MHNALPAERTFVQALHGALPSIRCQDAEPRIAFVVSLAWIPRGSRLWLQAAIGFRGIRHGDIPKNTALLQLESYFQRKLQSPIHKIGQLLHSNGPATFDTSGSHPD